MQTDLHRQQQQRQLRRVLRRQRRKVRMRSREITVITLLLLSSIPLFFTLGPHIENRLNPVFTQFALVDVNPQLIRIKDAELVRVYFRTFHVKVRPYCTLESFEFIWHFNSVTEAAEVHRALDDQIFMPSTVVRTGEHISRVLYTDIPTVAYTYKNPTLLVTVVQRCHPLWPLVYSAQVTVKLPEGGTVEEKILEMLGDPQQFIETK